MKTLNPMLLCDCYKIGHRLQYPNVKNITLRKVIKYPEAGRELQLKIQENHKKWNEEFQKEQKQKKNKSKGLKR